MVNAVLLFGVAAFVLIEAWRRFVSPPEVAGGLMLLIAVNRVDRAGAQPPRPFRGRARS